MRDKTNEPKQEGMQSKQATVHSSGTITDTSLAQIREQIKNVMIPLLIKVFHLKLEAQQATSPPSRLHKKEPHAQLEDVIGHLQRLDEDLKQLGLWSQSCRSQIHKVLNEIEEEVKPPSFSSTTATHPHVQKFLADAIATQKEGGKTQKPLTYTQKEVLYPSQDCEFPKTNPPHWWQKIFGS